MWSIRDFSPCCPDVTISRLRDERQVGPPSMPPERGPFAKGGSQHQLQARPSAASVAKLRLTTRLSRGAIPLVAKVTG